MLIIKDLNVSYGHIHALKGINIEVHEGEIVSLIGSNGAGKSTTLNTISGIVKGQSGSIKYQDDEILNLSPYNIVKKGICLVPEGREVFPALSVQQNLRLGAYTINSKSEIEESFEKVYQLFPRLKERINQAAGTLSGGEQQMLVIGRALMSQPKLLMLDEPSLGLAPNLVQMIFELIQSINRSGMTILLIEQNANMALSISNRAYVLETGTISVSGPVCDLRNDQRVVAAYLGLE